MSLAVRSRVGLQPVLQQSPMLADDILELVLYSKVAHLATVVLHVEELIF